MTDIVAELRPMGRITSLSTLDERFHLSRSRLQTESEAEAHRSELARFIIENGWDGKYKPVTTAVYHEKHIEAMRSEIEHLRLSLSEARATGRREGMEEAAKVAETFGLIQVDFGDEAEGNIFSGLCTFNNRLGNENAIAAAIRAAMEKAE